MGVSGSGKSTVGAALARLLKWPFFDGDKFHPESNVAKMAAGQPLTDEDRAPWLERIHKLIAEKLAAGDSLIVACSALKSAYRRALMGDLPDVQFLYLKGERELIAQRLNDRQGHFMPAELLDSQFATLEEPGRAVIVDISSDLDEVVVDALLGLAFANP